MNSILINSFWILFCSSLILLMHFGIALYYGGLVSKNNTLNTIKMTIVNLGIVPIFWWVVGYSLIFSPGNEMFWGNLNIMFLHNIDFSTFSSSSNMYAFAFLSFHVMFASISPSIISGSAIGRFKFNVYLIFIILWELLVYCPIAHSLWNSSGWALNYGAFDFAGGLVVHVSAGFSALALAIIIKPRKKFSVQHHEKHNLPMMVLGSGLLWFGWFGFNAGSSLELNKISLIAFTNTLFAPAASMITWLILNILTKSQQTITGLCASLIIGLVAITPSAGYVTINSSLAIGTLTSFFTYFFNIYYNRFKNKLDDTLDVFTGHGFPGILGGILVGIFASHNINPIIPDGLIYGKFDLLSKQIVVTVIVSLFSFLTTYLILYFLDKTIGIRVNIDHEKTGLDSTFHGENAYNQNL